MTSHKNIAYVPGRKSPWLLTIYTDGTRKRKFFKTEKEAIRRSNEIESEKRINGLRSMFFSPEERAEYFAAKEILEKANRKISVLDAVRAFEENLRKYEEEQRQKQLASENKRFDEAFEAYVESKIAAGRRMDTVRDINTRVGAFCRRFAQTSPDNITVRDIESYCVRENVSARTCKNDFAAISSFLNFCFRRGYMSKQLKFDTKAFLPRILAKQKTVFSLEETKAIFKMLMASEARRKYIPFYALQFFCGIRRTEAERMRWEWIDCEKKEIRLPAEITKTGDEHIMRPPMLPDTVFEWIKTYKGDAKKGLIPSTFRCTHNKITKECGWKRNVARHTFCTMHVSLHGDAGKTALLLRHRGQTKLWQNYLARIVPEAEAQAYFKLSPSTI